MLKKPEAFILFPNTGNHNNDNDDDGGEVDVTETTTTEVHTKSNIKKKPTSKQPEVSSVDKETKDQFNDAVDETVRKRIFFA